MSRIAYVSLVKIRASQVSVVSHQKESVLHTAGRCDAPLASAGRFSARQAQSNQSPCRRLIAGVSLDLCARACAPSCAGGFAERTRDQNEPTIMSQAFDHHVCGKSNEWAPSSRPLCSLEGQQADVPVSLLAFDMTLSNHRRIASRA